MMKRSIAVVVMLLALALTGCGPLYGSDQAVPVEYVEAAHITDEAIALVGRGPALKAAEEAVEFALKAGFDPTLLDPQQQSFTAEELTSPLVQDALAPGTLTVWNETVAKAVAGDVDAEEQVRGLILFGIRQPTWTVNPDGKILYSQAISEIEVDVASTTTDLGSLPSDEVKDQGVNLSVVFTHVARLRFIENNYPIEVEYTRSTLYQMVPTDSEAGKLTPEAITTVTATPSVPSRIGSVEWPTPKLPKPPRISRPPIVVRPTVLPTRPPMVTKPATTPKPTTTKPTTAKPITTKPATTKPPTTTTPRPTPTTTPPQPTPTTTAPVPTEPTEPTPEGRSAPDPARDTGGDSEAVIAVAFAGEITPKKTPDPTASTPTVGQSPSPTSSLMWQIASFDGWYEIKTVTVPK